MELKEFLATWHDGSQRLLVHTSGSTGAPKPMWVEKQKMRASARATNAFLHLHEGDVTLLCMPLDYIAGKMVVVRALECGQHLVSVRPSNHPLASLPPDITHIEIAAMVPSQVWSSLQDDDEAHRLAVIRHIIIGGGAISDNLEAALRSMPNNIWSSYGMTETLSHIALRRVSGPEASSWYTPMPGVTVSLSDEGCVIIDAPHVHDGRLLTNDIAMMHPDGRRFRIIGRKDNVICSGGIKLQIETIEQKLAQRISQPFCITKRPDEKFGEAAVMLTTSDNIPADTLRACLSRYEMPKDIIRVSSIPRTGTGKIDRKTAAEMALRTPSLSSPATDTEEQA